jgi:hypothetical protein
LLQTVQSDRYLHARRLHQESDRRSLSLIRRRIACGREWGNAYPTGNLTTRASEALTPSRPVSYYILLGLSALALFAISVFLTILMLS